MSRFTIKNFMDVENSVGERMPGAEGRFARKYLDSEHLGISYFSYPAGVRSPMAHSHREQEEAYVVVGGSGRIRIDDEVHPIGQWDVIRVSPEAIRAFEAGENGLVLIAVGSDRPEGGDGVMAPSAWIDELEE